MKAMTARGKRSPLSVSLVKTTSREGLWEGESKKGRGREGREGEGNIEKTRRQTVTCNMETTDYY